MPGKVFWFLLVFLLCALQPSGKPGNPALELLRVYQKADSYFNSANPTEVTDSLALAGFEKLITVLGKSGNHHSDTLLFQALVKKGILLDIKGNNKAANTAYLQSVAIHFRNYTLSDSLLFRVYTFLGSNYYNLNDFDSANYFLIGAEKLISRYPAIPDQERLYNTLGALHFSNGNYLQSRNYFGRAFDLLRNRKPYDSIFAQGLQANIASAYYKMGRYQEALDIYNKILGKKGKAAYIYNSICMNMGKAYQALKSYPNAMACFRRINPVETPGVWNEMAMAYLEQSGFDSAGICLDNLQAISGKASVNMLDIGINALYRAELQFRQKDYQPAIHNLQAAICSFSGNFSNRDIYMNPQGFSGSYTYFRLFEALHKKAQGFNALYQSTTNEKFLVASLETYQSALKLLAYIEKSYDTDDAKFFLKKNSGEIYSEALSVALRLRDIHPQGNFLETAFRICEQNKASVLAANLRQRSITAIAGLDSGFLQKERNIKFNIARLDIQSQQETSNEALEKLAKQKANYEIALSQLQKGLEQNNHYFRLKYGDLYHGSNEIMEYLEDNQAAFNFYQTNDALHVFAFTHSQFRYQRIDLGNQLNKEVLKWIQMLQNVGDGRKFNGQKTGQLIYQHLVKPMQDLVPGKDEWIIIPDGTLCLLPFESLPANDIGDYLLEKVTISYQYSSQFLLHPAEVDTRMKDFQVLAFAPFASAVAGKDQLAGSIQEIEGLAGNSFIDSAATKEKFLQDFKGYPVIHLATHAIGDGQQPAKSYVSFYPRNGIAAMDNLYLEEVYGLNMEACKLMIISACETGNGEWVNNEGVISLGRAFAYAGCGSTINSLWKADDKATAFILKNFHEYIKKGFTKSKALQKAKLDYINSDALYKSPAYWSNLILTGSTSPLITKTPSVSRMMLLFFCGLLLLIYFMLQKGRKKVDARETNLRHSIEMFSFRIRRLFS